MADTDENKSRPMTHMDVKENLKNNSTNKMRYLVFTLIDSLNKIVEDKENLKNTLEKCEEEVELISEKIKLKDNLSMCKE